MVLEIIDGSAAAEVLQDDAACHTKAVGFRDKIKLADTNRSLDFGRLLRCGFRNPLAAI